VPEHDKLYVLFPEVDSVIVSDPDVSLVPDQSPLAEQDVAFVEDQVMINSTDVATLSEEETSETDGVGAVGVWPASFEESDPPPPQADKNNRVSVVIIAFLVRLII
jgi:hypothetical protein